MLTMRSNRWSTLNGFRDEVDRLFGEVFSGLPAAGFVSAYPALNVWEDAEHIRVEAELPGLKLADLEVMINENDLTIRGRRDSDDAEGVTYHRRERGVGAFSRTIRLPVAIDADHVEATMNQGVLLITLPKAPEARPRKIEIRPVN